MSDNNNNINKLKKYLTVIEAAQARNITESCLRKRIKQGKVPVKRTGKCGYLIKRDDLELIALGKQSGRTKGSKNKNNKEKEIFSEKSENRID